MQSNPPKAGDERHGADRARADPNGLGRIQPRRKNRVGEPENAVEPRCQHQRERAAVQRHPADVVKARDVTHLCQPELARECSDGPLGRPGVRHRDTASGSARESASNKFPLLGQHRGERSFDAGQAEDRRALAEQDIAGFRRKLRRPERLGAQRLDRGPLDDDDLADGKAQRTDARPKRRGTDPQWRGDKTTSQQLDLAQAGERA